MKRDFCEAKYVTDHSVSALLTRGAIENDFCTATELTASESEQPTQPVKIAELMELNTFVHHYSERTRQYATQIERLRERSNQLRAEAAQLLHRHPLNEWHTR
ncbi:hypothetical protein [Paenibacillus wenxiniae]|uniref:Uncharacterized protein n=1 Tax=Paenibacillus wenxiniae TaxID=1636843 RepID=A0ABW4RHD5_9BACL